MYVCMSWVCGCVCMSMYVCVTFCVCEFLCLCLSVCVGLYLCMYVCVCVCVAAGHLPLVKFKLTSKMHDHEIRLCLPGCIFQNSFARPWQRGRDPESERWCLPSNRGPGHAPNVCIRNSNGFLLKANQRPVLLFPLQRPGPLATAARPLPPTSWGCCKLF